MRRQLVLLFSLLLTLSFSMISFASKIGSLNSDNNSDVFPNEASNETYGSDSASSEIETIKEFDIQVNGDDVIVDGNTDDGYEEVNPLPDESFDDTLITDINKVPVNFGGQKFNYYVLNESSQDGYLMSEVTLTITGTYQQYPDILQYRNCTVEVLVNDEFLTGNVIKQNLDRQFLQANKKTGVLFGIDIYPGNYTIHGRLRCVLVTVDKYNEVKGNNYFLLNEDERSNILDTYSDITEDNQIEVIENTICNVEIVNNNNQIVSAIEVPYGAKLIDYVHEPVNNETPTSVFDCYLLNGKILDDTMLCDSTNTILTEKWKSKTIVEGLEFNRILKECISSKGSNWQFVFNETSSTYEENLSAIKAENNKYWDISEAQDESTIICCNPKYNIVHYSSKYNNLILNENASGMFKGISGLTRCQVPTGESKTWYMNHVTNLSSLFDGCTNLEAIIIPNWNTSSCTNLSSVFKNCGKLSTLDLSLWDTSKCTDMSQLFSGCTSTTSINISSFTSEELLSTGDMFKNCSSLLQLQLPTAFTCTNVENAAGMFYNCSKLTSINTENLVFRNCKYMHSMFDNCKNLVSLDLTSFETSNVENFGFMFANCQKLRRLDYYTTKFNTSSATDLYGMFAGCGMLCNIDVSKFKTGNVIDMGEMFNGCLAMTEINCANWDVRRVTNFYNMFNYTINCSSINVTGWNTQSAENMNRMFCCSGITSIDVSSFDTRNVKVFDLMFSTYGGAGKEITSITYGSLFLPTSGTSFSKMFYGCVANKPVKQQWTGTWSSDGTYSL